MSEQKYVTWNPWHGCTKYSEGCRYCYVYRQDEAYGSSVSSEQCRKTQNFNLPVKKKRDGGFKVEPGSIVMTCFTSDFLLKDADEWRGECWEMIKAVQTVCSTFLQSELNALWSAFRRTGATDMTM